MKEKLNAFRQWLRAIGLQSSKRIADLCFGVSLAMLLSALIDQQAPIHIDLIGHPGYVIPTERNWMTTLWRVLLSMGFFAVSLILDKFDRFFQKEQKEEDE